MSGRYVRFDLRSSAREDRLSESPTRIDEDDRARGDRRPHSNRPTVGSVLDSFEVFLHDRREDALLSHDDGQRVVVLAPCVVEEDHRPVRVETSRRQCVIDTDLSLEYSDSAPDVLQAHTRPSERRDHHPLSKTDKRDRWVPRLGGDARDDGGS
jgi:hypothetical protein